MTILRRKTVQPWGVSILQVITDEPDWLSKLTEFFDLLNELTSWSTLRLQFMVIIEQHDLLFFWNLKIGFYWRLSCKYIYECANVERFENPGYVRCSLFCARDRPRSSSWNERHQDIMRSSIVSMWTVLRIAREDRINVFLGAQEI